MDKERTAECRTVVDLMGEGMKKMDGMEGAGLEGGGGRGQKDSYYTPVLNFIAFYPKN